MMTQAFEDFRADQDDATADRKLAMARYFAAQIATAVRENLSRNDHGRFVSSVRNLTRAELRIGPFREAA